MAGPEIETRRPRAGRCERCDRPLTDEVLVAIRPDWWEWRADDPDDRDDVCPGTRSGHRQRICFGTPVDWRARALAAEAALAEERQNHGITQTALDLATAAQGLSPAILAGDAFRDGARHGLLAAALAVTRVHHQAASLPTVPSAAVRALAEAVRSIEAFDRCVAPMFAEETPDA